MSASSPDSRRISAHIAARASGSSPVVGSSRNSTRGRCTRAAATSSRRRMPPEKVLTRAPGCLCQAEVVEQAPRARAGVDGVHAAHAGRRSRGSPWQSAPDRCSTPARRSRSTPRTASDSRRTSCRRPRRAGGRRRERGEDTGRGGLAGAVRSEEAEHRPRRHGETQSVEGMDVGPAAPTGIDLVEVVGDDGVPLLFAGMANIPSVDSCELRAVFALRPLSGRYRFFAGRTSCGRAGASSRRSRR